MIVGAALCPSPPLLARGLTGQADILPELRAACAAAVTWLLAARPGVVAVVGPADETASCDPAARLDLSGYAPALASPEDNSKKRGAPPLPLALGIGALLLDETGYAGPRLLQAVAASAVPDECARLGRALAGPGALPGMAGPAGEVPRVALLVVGDGTARRSLSAPGYLDERAEPFDAAVERALRDGDLSALAAMDPALAADLMATNRAPLQVLAGALAESAVGPEPAGGTVTALGAPSAERAGTRCPKADIRYSAAPFGVAYLVATVAPPSRPAWPRDNPSGRRTPR